jgi:hypothetical protein
MPDDKGDNGGEVSDPMSENEDESETFVRDDDTMAEQNASDGFGGEVKKKWDPKDPARPRRKKARRACFACQRAHLTCGMCQPRHDELTIPSSQSYVRWRLASPAPRIEF